MNTANPTNTNAANSLSPIISVVMITYNHAPYIEEAISSILAQEFTGSLELIIGEDCSTDETAKIVRDFYGRHPKTIKIITSESNVGMNANFKRCVEACTGEYIAFCEGDDYWSSSKKLQLQTDFIKANPQFGAVHSEFSHIMKLAGSWRKLERFNLTYHRTIPASKIFRSLLVENRIQSCTLFAKRSCILDYYASGIPIDTYAVGDWPICLFVSATSDIGYINEPLATYRLTPGSVTNSGLKNSILRAENAMKMAEDFCARFNIEAQVRLESEVVARMHILRLCFFAGEKSKFDLTWEWLRKNDVSRLDSKWLRRFRFAINKPLLRLAIMKYLQLDEFFARLRTYKPLS